MLRRYSHLNVRSRGPVARLTQREWHAARRRPPCADRTCPATSPPVEPGQRREQPGVVTDPRLPPRLLPYETARHPAGGEVAMPQSSTSPTAAPGTAARQPNRPGAVPPAGPP